MSTKTYITPRLQPGGMHRSRLPDAHLRDQAGACYRVPTAVSVVLFGVK